MSDITDIVEAEEKTTSLETTTKNSYLQSAGNFAEAFVVEGVSWAITVPFILNFGGVGLSVTNGNKRWSEHFNNHFKVRYQTMAHGIGAAFGVLLGAYLGPVVIEGPQIVAHALLFGPYAPATYFGQKILTNVAGYFYYRRQDKKHKAIEEANKYLLEEPKKFK